MLVYAGAMSLLDKERVQSQLLDLAGLADPFKWPLDAATDLEDDPRFILPEVIPAIVGRKVEIWKDSVHYRNGTDATQSATSDLTLGRCTSDRWTVTPTIAGEYDFTVTEGEFTAATMIDAIPMLAVDATKKRIVWIGDSNTARAGSGWIEYIGNELGSARVEMVGSLGPNSTYTYKHEGRDSWTWAPAVGSAGSYNRAGSPFFNGGGSLDVAGYLLSLANLPDFMMWTLGQNDVYLATEGTLEAAITAAFVEAELLLAAFTAELPTVKHGLAMNFPMNMDPASGWDTAASRLIARRKVHRYVERLIEQFGDREDEGIYIVPTFFRVDPIRGYADAIHMNSSPGHEQLGEAYLAWLVAHWT